MISKSKATIHTTDHEIILPKNMRTTEQFFKLAYKHGYIENGKIALPKLDKTDFLTENGRIL